MTNRPLTAAELADARTAYNAIGRLYSAVGHTATLGLACAFLGNLIDHNTTDGKPLRAERVPTKDDIGRRVKCSESNNYGWVSCKSFVGFSSAGEFIAELPTGMLSRWNYCIIDEEVGQ
jgi:hypothetical protein